MPVSITKRIAGVQMGMVTCQKRCSALAPSTSAASISELGTSCSAARKMTMAVPCAHTWMRIRDGFASSIDEIKGMTAHPQLLMTELITP